MRLKCTVFLVFLIPFLTKAQKGNYLGFIGGPQRTTLKNFFDESYGSVNGLGETFSLQSTYKTSFGIEYMSIPSESIGWRTGLSYSVKSQRYTGNVAVDTFGNRIPYNSIVNLRYLSLPFLMHFSSKQENTKVYFTLGMGVVLNTLIGSSIKINSTDPSYSQPKEFRFRTYFKPIDPALALSIDLFYELDKSGTNLFQIGFWYELSMISIEKESLKYGPKAASEWKFPVGTLKEYGYEVDQTRLKSYDTKIEAAYLRIGIVHRIKKQ